jgi:lysophospholipase L1-like esterase
MRESIVCYGDSNTWGFNAENELRFPEHIRWPGVLSSLLGEQYKVIEEGLSGRTSVMDDPLFEGLNGLTYITPCLKSHSPIKLVIIMLGTNDTKERFGLTSYNIAQGIMRVVQKAKHSLAGENEESPNILVICPPRIGEKYRQSIVGDAMGNYCAEKSAQLAQHLKTMTEREMVSYLDASAIPMNEIDYMHLTEEGHKQLAQLVFDKVSNLLEK